MSDEKKTEETERRVEKAVFTTRVGMRDDFKIRARLHASDMDKIKMTGFGDVSAQPEGEEE